MKSISQTPRWKLHLFWYLSYTYFQNEHFFNSFVAKLKSLLSGLEDCFFKKRWVNVDIRNPIFIIGPHRSGTTILQQALCLHSSIVTPRTYSDVIDMAPILSKRFIQPLFPDLSDRMVDRIIVGSDTPQEAQGLISRFFYKEQVTYNPMNSEDIKNYMRKLLCLEGKTRFLWKAPFVTNHVLEISSLFPDCQFIYIHRDPITCIDSKLKFIEIWQELAKPPLFFYRHLVGKHKNFNQSGMGYFMEQVNRTVNLHFVQPDAISMTSDHLRWIEDALRDLNSLNSPKRCCFLNYETLVDKPKNSLNKLFEFLRLPDESDNIILKMEEIGMPLRKSKPEYKYIPRGCLSKIEELNKCQIQKIFSAINWDNWYLIDPRTLSK